MLAACAPERLTAEAKSNISIYSGTATVVPQSFVTLPTMKIWVPTPQGSATPLPAEPTPTATAPVGLSEPADLIQVEALALPFDPDEIAQILRENPSLQFRYKHRAFPFPNCSTVTHLGEVMELYTHFNEGDPDAPPPPAFNIYAPTDMRILKLWGTDRYRLVMNSRIGINEVNKPFYLSLLSLTRLDENLANQMASLLGLEAQQLSLDYSSAQDHLGPYLFSSEYAQDVDDIRASADTEAMIDDSLLVRKGERIGYKEGPWEWYPTCETEHTVSLHVFPTTNDAADLTQAVETHVPAITYHYLNMVVRELVIERGLTIDVEYRARNMGHSHDRLASELFAPDVLEQITLIPWKMDRHPRRFTVAPYGETPLIYDDEME